jgi:hypothetical protein
MIIVTKAVKGQEFLYDASSSHEVSKASAKIICDSLNAAKFNLKEHEVWKIMEVDKYDIAFDYGRLQYFKKYKNSIRRYERRY